MASLACIVVPGVPHHVTQRGNRRERVFFCEDDYALYREMLAERCRKAGVACWAYCLMPNHVHLILVPARSDGLARALGETHRRYTGFVNARARQTGHLFQARFGSVAMDETHLVAAARSVSLNLVRAQLVDHAADGRWSSVRAHLLGRDDGLVTVTPVLDRVGPFDDLVETAPGEVASVKWLAPRAAETIGRPLGDAASLERIEGVLERPLRPAES